MQLGWVFYYFFSQHHNVNVQGPSTTILEWASIENIFKCCQRNCDCCYT